MTSQNAISPSGLTSQGRAWRVPLNYSSGNLFDSTVRLLITKSERAKITVGLHQPHLAELDNHVASDLFNYGLERRIISQPV